MDIGTLLLMVGFSYGIGVFWYDLLPGQLSMQAWRVAAYPFVGMALAEALIPFGPVFGGVHVGPAILGALVAVIVDWIITMARHPEAVEVMERPVTRMTTTPVTPPHVTP